jgi:hypothetical protein
MGFAVLHIQKPKGNDARTTAHIERTVQPANADPDRKHLNEEFIKFPEGVEGRTQAIQHRIENAGITRKIKENQIRALQVMLSGTPEDMQRIQNLGKLDEWCKDNIEWLQDTFGKDNVVSAVLHLDEKTPHIHATVVPIVQGERRKAKAEEKNGKKKYRKKPKDTVRLCADDIMTRDNLKLYQDSYAEAMQKFGLQRGIKGSDARHISTPQFYRDLYAQNESLKENIEVLQERKEEVNEKIWDMYDRKDEAREKFLDMDNYVRQKEKELAETKARLEQLQKQYKPYKAQDDINLLVNIFPKLSENLQMAQLCRAIGLAVDTIKKLFTGDAVSYSGRLHSPGHDQYFDVQEAKLQLYKERDKPDKLHLSLDGQNIIDWFRQKSQKLQETLRINPKQNPEIGKNKGFRM